LLSNSNLYRYIVVSLAASVVASLLTAPDPPAVLDEFYRRVRPWGFWEPVAARVCGSKPTPARATADDTTTAGTVSGTAGPAGTVVSDATPTTNSTLAPPFGSEHVHGRDAERGEEEGTSRGGGEWTPCSRNTDFGKDAFNVVVGVVGSPCTAVVEETTRFVENRGFESAWCTW
jgi:hypothetical protein